jgi:hypothetical protein
MFHRLHDTVTAPLAALFAGATGSTSLFLGFMSVSDIASACGAFAALVSAFYALWKWRLEYHRAKRDDNWKWPRR